MSGSSVEEKQETATSRVFYSFVYKLDHCLALESSYASKAKITYWKVKTRDLHTQKTNQRCPSYDTMVMFDPHVPYATIQFEGQREDVMIIATICNSQSK